MHEAPSLETSRALPVEELLPRLASLPELLGGVLGGEDPLVARLVEAEGGSRRAELAAFLGEVPRPQEGGGVATLADFARLRRENLERLAQGGIGAGELGLEAELPRRGRTSLARVLQGWLAQDLAALSRAGADLAQRCLAGVVAPGGGAVLSPAEEMRLRLAAGEFEFIDGGCGRGESTLFVRRYFDAGPGLGLERTAERCREARSKGLEVFQGDLTTLDYPPGCVSFVTVLDVLEHLPDPAATEEVLAAFGRAARDFVFIRHPNFEDTEYLAGLGLKLDWTDWHGHRNPMTLDDFRAMFRRLGLEQWAIFPRKPIPDSSHPALLPLSAAHNTVRYDEQRDGPKPLVTFERAIMTQFDILVRTGAPDARWNELRAHSRLRAVDEWV